MKALLTFFPPNIENSNRFMSLCNLFQALTLIYERQFFVGLLVFYLIERHKL